MVTNVDDGSSVPLYACVAVWPYVCSGALLRVCLLVIGVAFVCLVVLVRLCVCVCVCVSVRACVCGCGGVGLCVDECEMS